MGDKFKGFEVVLDRDYAEDEVKQIADSIRMIRGVADVSLERSNIDDTYALIRAKNELRHQILNVLV